jgi:protein gp37
VSPGCVNCYAERQAYRFTNIKNAAGVVIAPGPFRGFVERKNGHASWTGKVGLVEQHINDPLRWQKPRRIFVNSMSDLFHEGLSFSAIDEVFTVMIAAPQHTYQILTKRASRMREYFLSGRQDGGAGPDRADYHLDQNIWLGVSVEDGARKDRIDELRETPATVRFLSIEPLLEDIGELDLREIHWVIIGGESGSGARPFDIAWAHNIIEQCRAAGVACFFKQAGSNCVLDGKRIRFHDRKGGDLSELPPDLNVRSFPDAYKDSTLQSGISSLA